jgi:ribulose kinase
VRYAFDGSAWKAPTKLTAIKLGTRPDCVVRGSGIDCFAVDTQKNLQTARLSSEKWGKWKKLAASVGLPPHCLVAGGKMDCFAQTSSRQLLVPVHGFETPLCAYAAIGIGPI